MTVSVVAWTNDSRRLRAGSAPSKAKAKVLAERFLAETAIASHCTLTDLATGDMIGVQRKANGK